MVRLVAALGFSQDDRETAASEAEALRDGSSDPHPGAVAGHAISLAVNPDLTGTVVHLVDAGTEQPRMNWLTRPPMATSRPAYRPGSRLIFSMLVRVGQPARTSVPTMSSRVSESLLRSLTTQTSRTIKFEVQYPASNR